MNYSIKLKEVNNPDIGIKAFATVTFGDCFRVVNIAVVESREGSLFVSMPSFRSKKQTEQNEPVYKEVCHPITAGFQARLYCDIFSLYEEMKKAELSEIIKRTDKQEEPPFTVAVTPFERDGSNIRGLARIYLDNCFVINNVSILQGKETEFVAMPSYAVKHTVGDGRTAYQDVCYPIVKEFREKISNEILAAYRKEKEKELPAEQEVSMSDRKYETEERELPCR